MNTQERVAALEGLLEKIKRKAKEPRVPSKPAVVAAPAAVAPPAPAPAATFVAPLVVPSPPPPAVAPSAQFDQAVEELLEAPLPLVSPVAARAEAPETLIAEPEPLEELDEGDLISVPPGPSASAPPPAFTAAERDRDLDFDEEEEEVPASSKRAKVASSLDEALASAEVAEEHEVPIKTPPPESGPQEAAPLALGALEAPRAPQISETLETDIGRPMDLMPTPEQLGETIELPEPSQAPLELDVLAARGSSPEVEPPPVSEELEVALPRRESVGVYDEALAPPPAAREDLRRYEEQTSAVSAPVAPIEPSGVIRRPDLPSGVAVSRFVAEAASFSPKSFVELLDASLRLGSS